MDEKTGQVRFLVTISELAIDSKVVMRISRILFWALLIGLGLSAAGMVLALAVTAGGGTPDSMGGTIIGHIAGVLSVYHLWALELILPSYWLRWIDSPRHGILFYVILLLAVPAFNWALLAFVCLWGLVKFRARYYMFAAGHCRKCGYNLQGLEKPRCPECGTPFDTDKR